jgi:hypothetical protein
MFAPITREPGAQEYKSTSAEKSKPLAVSNAMAVMAYALGNRKDPLPR